MDNVYFYWLVLLAIFAVLWWTAFCFSRHTFRIVALLVGFTAIAFVTWFGLTTDHPRNYASAFMLGGNRLAQVMFGPMLPGSISRIIMPGLVGWIGLLIVFSAMLVWFDRWSGRREQPRVTIPRAPNPEPNQPDLDDRRMLTEKLQFILPAVEVRRPATMPGSTTMDILASLAEKSGVQGSGIAAAIMRLLHALQGQPRTYEVRMFTDRCQGNGRLVRNGRWRRINVEVRDARRGQTVAAKVLQPCLPAEAAEKVAGYAARQVFLDDPSMPRWAVGSADGEDLSAYVLARETCPADRTFSAVRKCRQDRRARLEKAVWNQTGAGVAGYDLAGMYDLDGENLLSLLLHLRNRERYPNFWRGRHRFAISMGMLAGGPNFDSQWLVTANTPNGQDPARWWNDPVRVKNDIIQELRLAGLLRNFRNREIEVLYGNCSTEQAQREARLLLLRLARDEFRACRRHNHVSVLLWSALWSRRDRGASRAALSDTPRWWWHPRRRLWPLVFGLEIVKQRMSQLERQGDADDSLRTAQQRVWRRISRDGILRRIRRRALRRVRRLLGVDDAPGRELGKAPSGTPWQAVYNAACLHALPMSSGEPDEGAATKAIRLLGLAISDQNCDLDRPSEWIAKDPDLQSLRKFTDFVRDQAAKDFEPSQLNDVEDSWFAKLLPILGAASKQNSLA